MLKNCPNCGGVLAFGQGVYCEYQGFVDNLFWALWYNGLDGYVEELAGKLERATSWANREYADLLDCCESLELLWMILVQRFGDYGTSPRSGWIEDTRGAAEFLRSRIKRTWGEDDG